MNEPFLPISYNPHPTVLFIDGEWKLIENFRTSRISASCYYAYYTQKKEEKEGKITPINDELNEIFDKGSDIHESKEDLLAGARGLIRSERDMKIIHHSKKFTISGHFDLLRFDLDGRYLEDYKTTKFAGLYYFLRDGCSNDYIRQLSCYAYMKYVLTSVKVFDGVITKIAKKDDENVFTHRNSISRTCKLLPMLESRKFYLTHPVIRAIIKPEKYDEQYVIDESIKQMEEFINVDRKTGKKVCWKCMNCQYANINGEECIVKSIIEAD